MRMTMRNLHEHVQLHAADRLLLTDVNGRCAEIRDLQALNGASKKMARGCVQMIQYARCKETAMELTYEAFRIGFSDYIVPMEIKQEDFVKRFFGPEGNQPEHSFIALDDGKPVGVILGGVKQYEGRQTMRCGTLAIHPDYRGSGISKELFARHKEEAIACGCTQLFLEVIVGNDRAIHFYRKLGYRKIYDLSYYQLKDLSGLAGAHVEGLEVKSLSHERFEQEIQGWLHFHINWQNDADYIRLSENNSFVAAYLDEKLVGGMCVNQSGKISFLYVDPGYRSRGIASAMLGEGSRMLNLAGLSIGFPNNHGLEGFLIRKGFEKNKFEQYEMYLFL
nr:GNAT family N-acetyltransferase [Paenibacillus dendritiformis]